jgi:hypothetical protein
VWAAIGALVYVLILAFCALLLQAAPPAMFWSGLVVGVLACLGGWAQIAASKQRHIAGLLLMVVGFVFLLVAGPSLSDLQLRNNSKGKLGVVTAVRHDGGDWECPVRLANGTDVRPASAEEGCGSASRVGDRVVVITDPSGMLKPRVNGPMSTVRLVISGLLAALLLGLGGYARLMAPRELSPRFDSVAGDGSAA